LKGQKETKTKKTKIMKTLTALKNAQKSISVLKNNTCADFHTYDNLIDWDSLVKALKTIEQTIEVYEGKSVMKNANLVQNSIN